MMSSKLTSTSGIRQAFDITYEFIENLKSNVASFFFLNIFAPRGFGKTVFIRRIWDKYETSLPVSLVSIRELIQGDSFNKCDLLRKIINDLDFRLPRRVTQIPADYEISDDSEWLAEILVRLISRATQSERTILLMLDDYDLVPIKERNWFESKVLSQFARTRRVGVIITSEFELRFTDRISLRMRLESYALSSLGPEDISRSFPKYEAVSNEIYYLTGGLPLLTGELINELEKTEEPSAVDFKTQNLLSKYYGTLVSEIIFQDSSQHIQDILKTLSILRRFDVIILSKLLPNLFPDHYLNYNTLDYLDLIEQLGSQVKWRKQGGYALIDSIRIVIEGYVHFSQPKFFEQVNRAILVTYQELLKNHYQEYYLVELLYHKLQLLQLNNELNLVTLRGKITDLLANYLYDDSTAILSTADLDSIRNTLVNDPVLKDYIQDDALVEVQRLINSRTYETLALEEVENNY